MIYTEQTKKAMKLCFEAHKDQVDKCGMPYVFHPYHLAEQMTDEDTITAALLHDVVEDTDYTLEDLEKLYYDAVGEEMAKFYRPPQGIYSESNLKMAKELGYQTVFWSLAYADWNNEAQPTREQAFSKLLPRAHNGAVILLHSTSRTNAEILDELLTRWEEMGYRFESLDTLFEES